MFDWPSAVTPFGACTGGVVPELLSKLDAPEARVRARALQDLHLRLVAKNGGTGTPFLPVAVAAAPILGERLVDPGACEPQLPAILAILGDVAAGNHRLLLEAGVPPGGLARDDIGPAAAAQEAVGALSGPLLSLLDHTAPAVRAGAAFTLAWLPGRPAHPPALLARLDRERNPVARASILLALGYLGAAPDALRACRGERAPVGPCAALAAMLADPRGLEDDLAAALVSPPKPVVAGLPFGDGALPTLVARILGGATVRRGDLDRQIAVRERLPEPLRAACDGWTVRIAAGASTVTRLDPLDPGELSGAALAVLRDHAARLRAGNDPHLYGAFARAGLFGTRDANERALGLDPPGPLDRRSRGRPLWWWLHGARAGRVPLPDWLDAVVGPESLDALLDAAEAPFELYRDRFRVGGYDVEPLIAVLSESARALGLTTPALDERLAALAAHAANPAIVRGKGPIPWP